MNARAGWLRVFSQAARSPLGMVGLGITALVVAIAVIGPLFAPYPPTLTVTTQFAAPSMANLFGGDALGRDVLSRTLAGGWLLLAVSVAATVLGVGLGVALGIAAAYFGGWRDGLIMRLVDVVLAFPALVFALLMVSIVGPQTWLLIVAVAVAHAPQVARVVRAAALDVTEREFVQAVKMIGMHPFKVMTREVLPNVLTVALVEFGLRFTYSILIIASMSYLGIGLQPPAPNWGLMLNENQLGLAVNPWAMIAPITLIALLTVGLNMFTESLSLVARGPAGGGVTTEDVVTPGITPLEVKP